ncbi:MAG: (Fe-S)-binding protein [Fimbriimonadaceae bacterium]
MGWHGSVLLTGFSGASIGAFGGQTPTREVFMHLPVGQQMLFYILMAVSLGIMGAQIWARARIWRQGQPVAWKPGGWRSVASYVLAQKKVRSSRPKSGAPMHQMIFYGFLAMFVATTLLAIAKYSPVNFHQGTYYLWYELVFDLLGLLLVVGLAWALVRRLAFRPAAASHSIADTWALLLLLALGLTGYGLEAARIANSPQPWDAWSVVGYGIAQILPEVSDGAYVATWWAHFGLVFVFFAVLPQMRLRHIVLAIFASYGESGQHLGELKPISIEEVEKTGRIGVAEARDYSRWHLLSLDACMECGRCTEVCPAHGVGKTLNPKQVVQDIRAAAPDRRPVAAAVSEEALWACTTCNACVEACPVLIRHVDMIVDARRNLIGEGRFAGTGATMLRQLGGTGHAWGQPANSREEWMKGLDIPLCRDGVEFDVLFWVGCAGATDPGAVRTTKAVAKLLQRAGVRFACLGQEETCTGDPARRTGDEFTFQAQAQVLVEVFKAYGVKQIVTCCPHCFNTFANEYGQFGAVFEKVWHHTQLLAELVESGKLRGFQPKEGMRLTLHDPCYLGRVNNESDAPRAVLGHPTGLNRSTTPHRSPGTIAEPEHFGRKTLCCGAGGGRMWMEEAPDQRPGNRRARELVDTGADTVALACPFCRIMLDASIRQVAKEEVRLADVAELLWEQNEPGPADPAATPPEIAP